jgi:hypothetical protein
VVVGYFTDFNPSATGLAPRITANGDIPVQILDIATDNFSRFGKLMINESNNGPPPQPSRVGPATSPPTSPMAACSSTTAGT